MIAGALDGTNRTTNAMELPLSCMGGPGLRDLIHQEFVILHSGVESKVKIHIKYIINTYLIHKLYFYLFIRRRRRQGREV